MTKVLRSFQQHVADHRDSIARAVQRDEERARAATTATPDSQKRATTVKDPAIEPPEEIPEAEIVEPVEESEVLVHSPCKPSPAMIPDRPRPSNQPVLTEQKKNAFLSGLAEMREILGPSAGEREPDESSGPRWRR